MEGENLSLFDINLPPYYFTVLIPLVEITPQNGPTKFIKGSYCKRIVDINKAEIYAPLLSPGDVVIFDGRTLHQGSANHTDDTRWIAYMTFVANWYHDQTFSINQMLFPELSVN
jgi:ectoine hydroxylase-related dioxygenase (phytanoyl-CoA dioxygenase family)